MVRVDMLMSQIRTRTKANTIMMTHLKNDLMTIFLI